MVKVKCITKPGSAFKQEKWPTEMAARPIKGDLVRCISEDGDVVLKIVDVVHATYKGRATDAVGGHEEHPILEVHLDWCNLVRR